MAILWNKSPKNIKELTGTVVSDKMDKTRVVEVETVKVHPLYKKRYKVKKKYYIHDEKNESKAGDVVSFREAKPLSRLKRWALIQIIK